jgi:enoyl-CoA hydratase
VQLKGDMPYQHFNVETADRIACVAFDRVDRHNAADMDTFRELMQVMAAMDADDGVDIVILTGCGPRAFCAGVDFDAFEIRHAGHAIDWAVDCQRVFSAVECMRKPVVAAVNGLAYGFGAEIAMVCDVTLAADTAVFGMFEIRHGLLPAVLVTRGRDMVGRKIISYLAMTGDPFSAAEAKEYGLVNKVVPADRLMEEALAVARRIQRNSPLGVRTVKRLLNQDGERHSSEVAGFLPPLLMSEDLVEARAAFREKRPPKFRAS